MEHLGELGKEKKKRNLEKKKNPNRPTIFLWGNAAFRHFFFLAYAWVGVTSEVDRY